MVMEHPEAYVRATPIEQRFRDLRDGVPLAFTGGEVRLDRDIEQEGRKGHEFEIEVPDKGRLRQRTFWDGCRAYNVFVAYQPKYVIGPAAQYFLESLRDGPPAPP